MLNRDNSRINYSGLMKELKIIEKDYLSILPPKLMVQYADLKKEQQSFKADAVFNAAARMVRLLHVKYLGLIEDLKTNNPRGVEFVAEEIFQHTPLMIPSKVPGKVYVFPNLIVDTVDKINLRNTCWVICFDTLKSFNATRARKPKSWGPFFRGWAKIKKYEELSIMRALIRYTNICKFFTHEDIQALEVAYLEAIEPLKLIYADKPKDYITMFAQGGVNSCMTTAGEKKEIWKDILSCDHHPMSLFAYHPYIKGAYTVKNKKVVARTLLYKNSSGMWAYGRIFAINRIYFNKFEKSLLNTGSIGLKGTFARKITFNVPGIYSKSAEDYLLPVPYMDNVQCSLHGKFDTETKQFIVTFKDPSKRYNIPTSSTGGYIRASSLESVVRCDQCGKECRSKHPSWNGRYVFCSTACAKTGGYIYAVTIDGTAQLRQARDCYLDYFDAGGQAYTNRHSCSYNGGRRVIHSCSTASGEVIGIETDPEEYSCCGVVVYCGSETYCVASFVYEDLRKNKVIEKNTKNNRLICSTKGVVIGVTT